MSKKKLLLTVVCIVLLFIPTVLAVSSYRNAKKSPVTESAITKMELSAPDGTVYEFAKDNNTADQIDGNMIAYFVGLNKNAAEIASLPEPVAAAESYSVKYHSYDMETVYTYYFDKDPSSAYYKDANGRVYHIAMADATKFVYSKYAIALYGDAAAPTLTVSGNTVPALPKTASWMYQLNNGSYTEAPVALASGSQLFDISGMLSLSYDQDPDYLQVQVYNGDTQLYNDTYANLGALTFTENATLNVLLQAKWFDQGDGSSYGEAYYEFDVKVKAPPIFSLGATQVEFGKFVVITGKNVESPEDIVFSCQPEVDFEPVFFRDGEYVRALFPVSYTWTYSPTYTFSISCDGVMNTLTLSVTSKTFKAQGFAASTELVAKYRTDSTLQAFNITVMPYLLNQEDNCYFSNTSFTYPAANATIRTGFGLYRTITATGTTYRHEGVDLVMANGASVQAACDGVVIFANSTQLSGRTIIIDHGCGLKTLYAHLSNIGVTEGQVVSKGEVIGFAGDTGFTIGGVMHFGMYVFNVPVSPYDACESGIPMLKD